MNSPFARGAWCSRITAWIPGLLLCAAVGLKLAHPRSLDGVFEWLQLGTSSVPYAGAAVVACEAALGLTLLSFPRWTFARSAALAFFSLTAALLIALAFSPGAPSCGCLGEMRLFEDRRADAVFGAGRNVILVGLLLVGAR